MPPEQIGRGSGDERRRHTGAVLSVSSVRSKVKAARETCRSTSRRAWPGRQTDRSRRGQPVQSSCALLGQLDAAATVAHPGARHTAFARVIVLADGRLLASDPVHNALLLYDASMTQPQSFPLPGDGEPLGLAPGGHGDVLVTCTATGVVLDATCPDSKREVACLLGAREEGDTLPM